MTDPDVLRAMLTRFGCCTPESVPPVVQSLLRHGCAVTHRDHDVRLVAFGTTVDPAPSRACQVVTMGYVVGSLRA